MVDAVLLDDSTFAVLDHGHGVQSFRLASDSARLIRTHPLAAGKGLTPLVGVDQRVAVGQLYGVAAQRLLIMTDDLVSIDSLLISIDSNLSYLYPLRQMVVGRGARESEIVTNTPHSLGFLVWTPGIGATTRGAHSLEYYPPKRRPKRRGRADLEAWARSQSYVLALGLVDSVTVVIGWQSYAGDQERFYLAGLDRGTGTVRWSVTAPFRLGRVMTDTLLFVDMIAAPVFRVHICAGVTRHYVDQVQGT
jgi:hypothetical protein